MFSKSLTKFITLMTLSIAPFLIGYYSLKALFNTFYILIIPTSLFCVFAYLPILYLLKIKIKEQVMKKLILINSVILSGIILLIPSIIAVEIVNYGMYNIINTTLILFIGTKKNQKISRQNSGNKFFTFGIYDNLLLFIYLSWGDNYQDNITSYIC